jgi:hypothetical protein
MEALGQVACEITHDFGNLRQVLTRAGAVAGAN